MRVIVDMRSCVWLIAFTEWCVGIIPKVIFGNNHIIFDDPTGKSQVEILFNSSYREEEEIRLFTHSDSITRLWTLEATHKRREWAGMVSVNQYNQRLIQEVGLDSEHGFRALCQAMVYSTAAILNRIRPLQHIASRRMEQGGVPSKDFAVARATSNITYFSTRVANKIAECLGIDDPRKCQLQNLKEGEEIGDLHNVKQYTRILQAQCKCALCGDDPSSFDHCLVQGFEFNICVITVNILALSVFELTEPVKILFYPSKGPRNAERLLTIKIAKFLFPRSRSVQALVMPCPPTIYMIRNPLANDEIFLHELFDHGLFLIGHEEPLTEDDDPFKWVALAYGGQVVYPHIFESQRLEPRTAILIDGGPGTIIYEDEKYPRVISGTSHGPTCISQADHEGPVKELQNLYRAPDIKLD